MNIETKLGLLQIIKIVKYKDGLKVVAFGNDQALAFSLYDEDAEALAYCILTALDEKDDVVMEKAEGATKFFKFHNCTGTIGSPCPGCSH